MKLLTVILFVVLASIQLASAEVVLMTEKNFNVILDNSELTLVKFFAPWCGHCQKLAPEYEAAAVTLKGKAVLGEVDCTQDKKICEDHGIAGFPTLILFRYSEEMTKYSGPRNAKGLVSFVETFRRPAVQSVASAKDLKRIQDEIDIVALLVASSADAPIATEFNRLADKHRVFFGFVLATDRSVYPEAPLDNIIVLRKGESETYEGDGSHESYDAFFKLARVPYVGEISQATISAYNDILSKDTDSLPFGWLLIKKEDPELVESLRSLAMTRRRQLIMVWVNIQKFPAIAGHVGVAADAEMPAFSVKLKDAQFVFPADKPLNAENLGEFIEQSLSGSVQKTVRSAPTPEQETVKGLTTLTANTIDKYLSKTDMLILFYAPWCGHCKKFKPTFSEFAEKYGSSSLVIAEFDAVANDVDSSLFTVDGFPTLYFVPAGGVPVLYSGDRTMESLLRFVDSHKTSGSENAQANEAADL